MSAPQTASRGVHQSSAPHGRPAELRGNQVKPAGITIAMLTFRRPDDLEAAVPQLLAQTSEVDLPVTLLIIDNDPAGSAEPAIRALNDPQVRYVHEPRPGIAAARNRAMDETPAGSLLIFIDDDERPSQGWLRSMFATYLTHRSTAVVGPVISEYDAEPEAWIAAGRFFDRRRMPTGTRTDVAATNNLLLDLDRIRALGLRFDEQFGQSGGSDTLFTRQLAQAGHELVWCDEAVVVDKVPVGRLTRGWVLRRAFRSGNSWSRTSVALATGKAARWGTRARVSGKGLIRVVGGGARYLVGVLSRAMSHQARGLRTMARGAGLIAGATGYVFYEYRRPAADGPVPAGSATVGVESPAEPGRVAEK